MKSFLKLIAAIAVIILASAFLAPLLYKFLPFKFERIFNRLVMIFTIAGVLIAARKGFFSFPSYALLRQKETTGFFLTAFMAGFITLIGLNVIKAWGWGYSDWKFPEWNLLQGAGILAGSLGAALLIGVIEELFFRGLIFTSLRGRAGWPLVPSLIVTNAFYSVVHFIGGKKPFIGPEPGFTDSLRLIGGGLSAFAAWQELWPAAAGLFIFGCLLSFLFLETRSLYPCIAFHAGCVYFLKLDAYFLTYGAGKSLWLGTGKGYDGILGWIMLALAGGGLLLLFRSRFLHFFRSARAAVIPAAAFFLALAHPAEAAKSSWVSFTGEASNGEEETVNTPASRSGSPLSRAESSDPVSTEEAPVASVPEPALLKAETSGIPVRSVSEDAPPAEVSSPVREILPLEDEGPAVPEKMMDEEAAAEAPAGQAQPSAQLEAPLPGLAWENAQEVQPGAAPAPEPENRAKTPIPATPGPEEKNVMSAVSEAAPEPVPPSGNDAPLQPEAAQVPPPSPAVSKPAFETAGDSENPLSFVLSEHLPEAEIVHLRGRRSVNEAHWSGGSFTFPDLEGAADIEIVRESHEGALHEGISLRPVSGLVRRITFPEVPPGSRLILRYGIADEAVKEDPQASVYIKVWAGRHLLRRIAVPDQRGWKKEVIDLGVVSFLKNPVALSFDISADDVSDRRLSLYGEVR